MSNVQDNAAHTCSYSCDRPECIKAQRDELAAAAAHEAMAIEVPNGAIFNGNAYADRLETYGFECEAGPLTNCNDWVEFRRCFNHLADWAYSLPPLYAAPVTAAPAGNRTSVDSGALTLALNVLRRAGKDEVADALEATAVRGTPAAPGIDLEQFRPAVRAYRFRQQEFGSIAGMAEADRLQALIDGQADASPKGALNEQFGSAEGLDSPKGGSEAHAVLDALISLVAVARRYLPDYDEHPEIQKADDAIDAAMQAQAGDAEVQP